jgi:DNA-binding GntR family transcriptional regulator
MQNTAMTNANIPPPRKALHEELTQRLRQMLVENQIAPGAKLNERQLCETLSVSRTPLREAIKSLAAEGLVELLPNRGAVAASLSEEDVLHAFELLACLEGQAGWWAAQRITDAELQHIEAMHYEMMASYVRRDLPAYYRLNAAIHKAISQATHNPVFCSTYEQVNARLQALRFKSNQDGDKWKAAVAEHDQMVAALKAHDAQALRQVLVTHLEHKRDVVIAQLREEQQRAAQAAQSAASGRRRRATTSTPELEITA